LGSSENTPQTGILPIKPEQRSCYSVDIKIGFNLQGIISFEKLIILLTKRNLKNIELQMSELIAGQDNPQMEVIQVKSTKRAHHKATNSTKNSGKHILFIHKSINIWIKHLFSGG
jgi:hypothetical protein